MWLTQRFDPKNSVGSGARSVSVAIPARNEAETIIACLKALDASAARAKSVQTRVLVLVNNSSDTTAMLARSFIARHLAVQVVEATFPPSIAHVGTARRLALDLCSADLPADGVLMTTDADSRVDVDWIGANLREIAAGADAVAGVITFQGGVAHVLPALRQLEWTLAALHARLHALIDPRPHDPWPTHIWAWGASLAVTVQAYRGVGGLPRASLAEDRAFAGLLDRKGFRVRRSHAPLVFTSPRRHGRAPGGFADLLDSYIGDPSTLCDAALEPTATLFRRLVWRARLRRRHASHEAPNCRLTVQRLGLSGDVAGGSFGDIWDSIEQTSGRLRRERLEPGALLREVRRAERLIRLFERAADQSDSPVSDPAALAPSRTSHAGSIA